MMMMKSGLVMEVSYILFDDFNKVGDFVEITQ